MSQLENTSSFPNQNLLWSLLRKKKLPDYNILLMIHRPVLGKVSLCKLTYGIHVKPEVWTNTTLCAWAWRTRHKHVGVLVSNILTLKTGRLQSEKRVPQRWGSTLLSQILFPSWDSLLPSPDSLPGGLRRADCTNANNLAESVRWNGMKNQFYIRGLHQKNYKRKCISPTHPFFFLFFS